MKKKLVNIKVITSLIYLILLMTLLYFIFTSVDLKDLTNIQFIKSNKDVIFKFKKKNFLLLFAIFVISIIIWNFFLGVGTPAALASGFVFGKWTGTLIVILGNSLGATLIYLIAKKFFSKIIQKKLGDKFSKLLTFFNKNELLYFMFFRFVGGGGTPFPIQNIVPVIFNISVKNYFIATLIGIVPTTFVSVALGAGIENVLNKDSKLSFLVIITAPEIYLPIIGFGVLLNIYYLIKKFFFKK